MRSREELEERVDRLEKEIGSVAFGGAAVGKVAIGGGAVGEYACGGGAAGTHVISAARSDPEAEVFFRENGLGGVCPADGRRRLPAERGR